VFPVKYGLGFYIPEDDILHSHRRENLISFIVLTGWALYRRRNVFPVKYELGFYITEDDIPHSHCGENAKSYIGLCMVSIQLLGRSDMNCLRPFERGVVEFYPVQGMDVYVRVFCFSCPVCM
jgi:hypothetical protein